MKSGSMTVIQERLSLCWQRFLSCFKKPTQANSELTVNPAETVTVPENDAATGGELYIALYDYSPRTNGDLCFYAGDLLEVLDRSAGEWWFAKAHSGLSASKQGYIPCNYVAPVESVYAEQ